MSTVNLRHNDQSPGGAGTPRGAANPFPLVVLWQAPGDERLEQGLHARFEPFRITGEWFDFPDDVDPVTAVSQAAERLSAGLVAAS